MHRFLTTEPPASALTVSRFLALFDTPHEYAGRALEKKRDNYPGIRRGRPVCLPQGPSSCELVVLGQTHMRSTPTGHLILSNETLHYKNLGIIRATLYSIAEKPHLPPHLSHHTSRNALDVTKMCSRHPCEFIRPACLLFQPDGAVLILGGMTTPGSGAATASLTKAVTHLARQQLAPKMSIAQYGPKRLLCGAGDTSVTEVKAEATRGSTAYQPCRLLM